MMHIVNTPKSTKLIETVLSFTGTEVSFSEQDNELNEIRQFRDCNDKRTLSVIVNRNDR